ncbi:MAG: Lrp/AsnC family transcriptional regulator [Agrococcus casei]|uniref:Transcriptional regulator, AsnC family n=1 Tax=Agrococcus casei LMG 22410 TaxID=1255656 RepID=A0A1R4ESY8_9MICO|nr:Lrp/AsnC family transcriptional regulator [Agrococcus casei]SJM46824.1 Transcriptional regulator, AsnC family [Agrococcus casei LMG 22410]
MDRTDYAIIDQLRVNSRANYGDVGDEVGLSASAVKRRIDRLVAEGVITAFTVQIDPKVEGLATEAYVELFCRGTVAPPELKRILAQVPEVVEAYTVTGDADAIVVLRARDPIELEAALERVRATPQVERTRSALILSRLVQRAGSVLPNASSERTNA